MKNNKFINWLFIAAFLVFLFIYSIKILHPEYVYHIQNPAFLTDFDFLMLYLSYPGGVSEYISNYLGQYFYYGSPGALIICIVLFLQIIILKGIINKYDLKVYSELLVLIPVLLALGLLNVFTFPFAVLVNMLFIYIFFYIYLRLSGKISSLVILPILSALVYFIDGSGYNLIFLSCVILQYFFTKGLKAGAILLFEATVFTFITSYLSFQYLYNITWHDALSKLLPNMPITIIYTPGKLFWYYILYLPVLLLVISLFKLFWNRKEENKSLALKQKWFYNKWVKLIAEVLLIVVAVVIITDKTVDKHKTNIIAADYYCYKGDWDKVINIALSDNVFDVYMNYNYNRAIDNSGRYLEMYFNYPQLLGADGMFPDKLNAADIPFYCSDLYYDIGYISEAQHWAYEAQTIWRYSPRVMERIVMTNFIYGNFAGAEKYLRVLEKTLIAKDFVKKYMPYISDTNLIYRDEEIMKKRLLNPQNTLSLDDISERYLDLLYKDSTNRQAIDHLLVYYMLAHKFKSFANMFQPLLNKYQPIPKIYEQAYLYYLQRFDKEQLQKVQISQDTKNLMTGISKILAEYGHDKESARSALNYYRDSYYYYLFYYSPLVTKLTIQKENLRDNKIQN